MVWIAALNTGLYPPQFVGLWGGRGRGGLEPVVPLNSILAQQPIKGWEY